MNNQMESTMSLDTPKLDDYNKLQEWASLSPRFVALTHLTYRPLLELLIKNELLDATVVTSTVDNNLIIDVGLSDGKKHLLYEIYRVVEQCFRSIGGWTLAPIKDDSANKTFRYTVTIHHNEETKENTIVAFYRYASWKDCFKDGELKTPMTSFWDFDPAFIQQYKDSILELGTAGYNVELFTTDKERLLKKALLSSRTGLAQIVKKQWSKHFVGKMTIESNYPENCRNLLLAYLDKWRRKSPPSASPKSEYEYISEYVLPDWLTWDYAGNDKRILKDELKRISNNKIKRAPWMFDEYLNRIPDFEYLGTVKNGNVYESGIFVAVDDVDEATRRDHFGYVDTWQESHPADEIFTLGEYIKSLSEHRE